MSLVELFVDVIEEYLSEQALKASKLHEFQGIMILAS